MNFKTITPDKSIALFVKSIMVFEEDDDDQKTVLPFFADGYPGLMFHETTKGLFVTPHNKKMPFLFLYGQTIQPIELVLNGKYKLIAYQLYPFVLKSFFSVNPVDITDGCYDLQQLKDDKGANILSRLQQSKILKKRIEIISSSLFGIFQLKKEMLDDSIRQAIHLIIDNRGQINIKNLHSTVNLTERTFERRFLKETGILPKQFCQVIRFQHSLEQLTLKDYNKLTDIVYNNGFADQSHFTRVFKAFTGKTPKHFNKKGQ